MVAELVRAAKAEEDRLQRELEANPLYQRLQAVRRLLSVYGANPDVPSSLEGGRRQEPGRAPGRQRSTMALVLTQSEEYLQMIGRRAQSTEITQVLQERGIRIPGQFPSRVVSSILSQSDKFDNIRGQGYGLTAWARSVDSSNQHKGGEDDQAGPPDDDDESELEADRPRSGLDSKDAFGQNADRAATRWDTRPD